MSWKSLFGFQTDLVMRKLLPTYELFALSSVHLVHNINHSFVNNELVVMRLAVEYTSEKGKLCALIACNKCCPIFWVLIFMFMFISIYLLYLWLQRPLFSLLFILFKRKIKEKLKREKNKYSIVHSLNYSFNILIRYRFPKKKRTRLFLYLL